MIGKTIYHGRGVKKLFNIHGQNERCQHSTASDCTISLFPFGPVL